MTMPSPSSPGENDSTGFATADLAALAAQLTSAEAVDLLSGFGMWKTKAIERLGIPSITMTDGTYGVRYSIDQIDNDQKGGQDLDAFLSVVNQSARDVQIAWGTMKPATCFPNGSSLGCSWDVDLAAEMGAALATECQALGIHLLLGPGINTRRTPMAGRSYEYYSEDPVISGDIAAAIINGLQDNGVGASLKHFACNNSEVERTTMDSVVEARALREIYLRGFERAIARSNPWTVMSSYNRLNGAQAAEDPFLLTKVLREDWGYEGLVVSDWHGIKDRPASLLAGNDLDMPESDARKAQLRAAIESGEVSRGVVETACVRVLELVRKAKAGERRGAGFDKAAHHALARRVAAESIVLLKNAGGVLPLSPAPGARIVVVGAGATEAVIQGSGCATTTPTGVDDPLIEIRRQAGDGVTVDFFPGYAEDEALCPGLRAEALSGAAGADVVIAFVDTGVGYDGEGSDRRHLGLAPGHDALIEALAAAGHRVVVVLANPDAVVMPWIDEVAAVVETFFSGQGMGGALADILFGVVNPSGKLSVTFPLRLADVPGHHTYPGENGRHVYSEGLFVGYRWYDQRQANVLFPFGFGLSYSSFEYANLTLDRADFTEGDTIAAAFDVTNTGERRGKEICQLYASYHQPRLARPVRELKGYAKVDLLPGETKRVVIRVDAQDLAYWDEARGAFVLDAGRITLGVGRSSRDLDLSANLQCRSSLLPDRRVAIDTQPIFILDNPIAHKGFSDFLQRRNGIAAADADRMLEHCRNSFFGMFTTLERRLRQSFTRQEMTSLVDAINAAMDRQEERTA
jgi:beta-glucosidase